MDYLQWNDTIGRRFFNPDRSGTRVFLYVTTEAVNEIGAYRVASARLEVSIASERGLYLSAAKIVWKSVEDALVAEGDRAELERTRAQERRGLAREQADRLRDEEIERKSQESEASAREARLERDPLERFRLEMEAEVAAMRAELAEVQTELQHADEKQEDERHAKEMLDQEQERLERRLKLRGDGAKELLWENGVAQDMLGDRVLSPHYNTSVDSWNKRVGWDAYIVCANAPRWWAVINYDWLSSPLLGCAISQDNIGGPTSRIGAGSHGRYCDH